MSFLDAFSPAGYDARSGKHLRGGMKVSNHIIAREPTPAADPFAGVGDVKSGMVGTCGLRSPAGMGPPYVHTIRTLGGHALGVEAHRHADCSPPLHQSFRLWPPRAAIRALVVPSPGCPQRNCHFSRYIDELLFAAHNSKLLMRRFHDQFAL